MDKSATITMFIGPTAFVAGKSAVEFPNDVEVRPPVKRGDISRLTGRSNEPGTIAIVDGLFYQSLSVGHAELRVALERGWRLWGLSSMGAIRAYEMRTLGMIGWGSIYEMFLDHEDFQDDEVAMLHERESPYRPASEPMVHLRDALHKLRATGLISLRTSETVEEHLKSQWFGDRSWSALRSLLYDTQADCDRQQIDRFLGDTLRFQVKLRDLLDFVEQAPWRNVAVRAELAEATNQCRAGADRNSVLEFTT